MVTVTFLPANKIAKVPEGAPLLEAAALAGLSVETPCGGKGICGKCLVKIQSGAVAFDGGWLVGERLAAQGYVMICTARVKTEDITVLLPAELGGEQGQFADVLSDYAHIDPALLPQFPPEYIVQSMSLQVPAPRLGDGLSDLDRLAGAAQQALGQPVQMPLSVLRKLPEALRQSNGQITLRYARGDKAIHVTDVLSASAPAFAVAVDLGTTTVAATICGEDGALLAAKTAYNAQIAHGLDIISRINYASTPQRLAELREKALETVNGLIRELAQTQKTNEQDMINLSLSGNTTMIHLLLGISAEQLRLEPYTPAVYRVPRYTAKEIGLCIAPETPVDIAPSVGNYLGGDIVSGALCTALAADTEELCLLIDIGTNGEILLGNRDFLMGCACSAGPAFEGGGISCGMRASAGAIERVWIDGESGEIRFSVIGNGPPLGICGSGMISLLAELLRAGWIDAGGKLNRGRSGRIVAEGKNASLLLSNGEAGALSITESDINNLIRAKAALFSACRTLLKSADLCFADVAHVYVAGGFGRYLDLDDARAIGLMPPLPAERFSFIGNASLMGTHMALVSARHREKREALAGNIAYLDLSAQPGYMDEYMAALFLPHTDQQLFNL